MTIVYKVKRGRKAGALSDGDLLTGEIAFDITNGVAYVSLDGSTVDPLGQHIVYLGDKDAGNYTLIEADGTLVAVGDARTYEDWTAAFGNAKIPPANAPNWATLVGNIPALQFDIDDWLTLEPFETAHAWDEGTLIEMHLHWVLGGTDVDNRTVKWEVEFSMANMDGATGFGDVFPNPTVATSEIIVPADTPDRTHVYQDWTATVMTDIRIGTLIVCNVRRIASSGTEPSSDPFGLQLGIHAIKSRAGSRSEYTA